MAHLYLLMVVWVVLQASTAYSSITTTLMD
jgi:hypothetical protein